MIKWILALFKRKKKNIAEVEPERLWSSPSLYDPSYQRPFRRVSGSFNSTSKSSMRNDDECSTGQNLTTSWSPSLGFDSSDYSGGDSDLGTDTGSSGFDFDGGSSDGGGASGDW